eukprot:gene8947-biopygen9155
MSLHACAPKPVGCRRTRRHTAPHGAVHTATRRRTALRKALRTAFLFPRRRLPCHCWVQCREQPGVCAECRESAGWKCRMPGAVPKSRVQLLTYSSGTGKNSAAPYEKTFSRIPVIFGPGEDSLCPIKRNSWPGPAQPSRDRSWPGRPAPAWLSQAQRRAQK